MLTKIVLVGKKMKQNNFYFYFLVKTLEHDRNKHHFVLFGSDEQRGRFRSGNAIAIGIEK